MQRTGSPPIVSDAALLNPDPGNGAAQESNLPSRGLHDRTGFEDQLGHRAHAAPSQA